MTNFVNQAPRGTTPNLKSNYSNSTSRLVLDEARGQWANILSQIGIDQKYLMNKHGPCPMCGGRDRFRFDNLDGRGTFICNQCGAGDGLRLLMLFKQYDFESAVKLVSSMLGITQAHKFDEPRHVRDYIPSVIEKMEVKDQADKCIQNLRHTWSSAKPISFGDPASRYLESRAIVLNEFPAALRFHPNLPYFDNGQLVGYFPAMVGIVRARNNRAISIHRTYLGESSKADLPSPKKLMTPIYRGSLEGAAIKLYPPSDGVIAVAEGVETALAFHISSGLPVWATISAWGLEKVVLPETVNEVVIAVDNDISGRGQEAALKLASRLLAENKKVRRVMPPKLGTDFADLLMEGC